VPYAGAYAAPDEPDLTQRLRPAGSTEGTWSIERSDEAELVWRSPDVVPTTSARPEFRAGGRLLGYPTLDGDGRTLRLRGGRLPGSGRLQVWLGIRGLDGPTPALRSGALPGLESEQARDIGIDPAEPGPYDVAEFGYRGEDLPWRTYRGDLEV